MRLGMVVGVLLIAVAAGTLALAYSGQPSGFWYPQKIPTTSAIVTSTLHSSQTGNTTGTIAVNYLIQTCTSSSSNLCAVYTTTGYYTYSSDTSFDYAAYCAAYNAYFGVQYCRQGAAGFSLLSLAGFNIPFLADSRILIALILGIALVLYYQNKKER